MNIIQHHAFLGNRINAYVFLIGMMPVLLAPGCGHDAHVSDANADTHNAAVSASKSSDPKTTTVEPSGTNQDKSPATADSELPDAEAQPNEVCLRFMNLLKAGNRLTAERLLTRRAETVTNRGGFPIQPLGSPAATYRIGDVHYATNKLELANVDCQIVDELNGQSVESTITWMVRKQKEGWRISGIIFNLSEDQPADLLSFENPDDVAHLKTLIEQQTADASNGLTK